MFDSWRDVVGLTATVVGVWVVSLACAIAVGYFIGSVLKALWS